VIQGTKLEGEAAHCVFLSVPEFRVTKGGYIGAGKRVVHDWREISLLIDEPRIRGRHRERALEYRATRCSNHVERKRLSMSMSMSINLCAVVRDLWSGPGPAGLE